MRESFGQYEKFCLHRGFNSLAAPPSPAPGVNNIAYMPQIGDWEINLTQIMMNCTYITIQNNNY